MGRVWESADLNTIRIGTHTTTLAKKYSQKHFLVRHEIWVVHPWFKAIFPNRWSVNFFILLKIANTNTYKFQPYQLQNHENKQISKLQQVNAHVINSVKAEDQEKV